MLPPLPLALSISRTNTFSPSLYGGKPAIDDYYKVSAQAVKLHRNLMLKLLVSSGDVDVSQGEGVEGQKASTSST